MQALAIATPAFFIALTTMAGRSYVLSFYQTLGIPLSEIDYSALDYALASPSVLTYVIAITLSFAGFHWWTIKWPNTGNETWIEALLPGIGTIGLGILFAIILPHLPSSAITSLTILRGMGETLQFIFLVGGIALVTHSVFAKQLVNEEPESTRKFRHSPVPKVLILMGLATLVYSGVNLLWDTPARMGKEDASFVLANPASAEMVISNHPQCATGCSVGVVMTSNLFVYVRSDVGITAYPLSRITGIDYYGSTD